GPTGMADFWFRVGRVPYPVVRLGRPIGGTSLGIETELAEIVGSNVTQSFSSGTGSTPVTSPESRISVNLPTLTLIVYVGGFWYDANNPTDNLSAKIYRRVVIDDAEIRSTRGL